jgi:hypothetical protein
MDQCRHFPNRLTGKVGVVLLATAITVRSPDPEGGLKEGGCMAGEYAIVERERGVWVQFKGGSEITPDLIIEAIDREIELFHLAGQYNVWDFRGCFPSDDFGYSAMLRIIQHKETHYSDQWSAKTAILVDGAIQFGLSRMFQILYDGFPPQIAVFRDEARARLWIGEKTEKPWPQCFRKNVIS